MQAARARASVMGARAALIRRRPFASMAALQSPQRAPAALPPHVKIYGGSPEERAVLTTRLARLREFERLKQESIGLVILKDTFFQDSLASDSAATMAEQSLAAAKSGSGSGSTNDSSPLAEAFLDFPFQNGVILTVFNVSQSNRRLLATTHGDDVLEAWAKDTLRSHLSAMGSVSARFGQPMILEPALVDLADEEAVEDDDALSKALTKKRSLAATAQAGSLIPARYLEPGRMICLVFPRRELRSSEGLHRVERTMLDSLRKQRIGALTYYVALDLAYSPDAAAREQEARRFRRMAECLPPGSLLLGEEAALDALVEWTRGLPVDVTTFYLSMLNLHWGSPTDMVAGPQLLAGLGARDAVLVADDGHHPSGHAKASGGSRKPQEAALQTAAQRGQRVAASLEALFRQRGEAAAKGKGKGKGKAEAHGLPERLGGPPRVVAGSLEQHLDGLAAGEFKLVVLHSGNYPIDTEVYATRLQICKDAGVPVATPSLVKSWHEDPRSLAMALKPWPPSFLFSTLGGDAENETEAEAQGGSKGGSGSDGSNSGSGTSSSSSSSSSSPGRHGGVPPPSPADAMAAAAAADQQGKEKPWDFGFRKTSFDCSECESWSCGPCTKHQQQYAASLGKHHAREMGQEWREPF